MTDKRTALPVGTAVVLGGGSEYEITGAPIGFGGGSILYPVRRRVGSGWDGLDYVLKECWPVSAVYECVRSPSGEILPKSPEDRAFLARARRKHLEEGSISRSVYQTASRMLPIRETSERIQLRLPGGEMHPAENAVSIMDSLSGKGQSIADCIRQKRRFTAPEAFRILAQLLAALDEVHRSGYLHLDLQDGNVFLRGALEERSELLTLIDFGSARPMYGGKTEAISDRMIYTSPGYTAPEILRCNDGTLQLGPEADLYSAGCLAWFLLTGHRASTQQFLANHTGRYLRPNELRRIQCPPHLVERLQDILARSLAPEPENRYHSAAEMLAEVNDLVSALQPYRTDLSNVKYDAFICYKHGEIDSAAALKLQKQLEEYVYQHKKPFRRVFVDEGELSSCADFGQQIREALKNSGWLIVVCSPDTPASPWVQREIDAFLETHDRSRILAVLTSGEAAQAFPPQLLGEDGQGEVLAADARGATLREVTRKLKGDALLKLAAPMLGTTFDSLKQRQKARRAFRIALSASVLTAATLCFALYAANRAAVIRQQADALASEYRNSLISGSRILMEQAWRVMDDDPTSALELLLQALPSPEQDRPVLPEAVRLLSNILNVYWINRYSDVPMPYATHSLRFDSGEAFCADEQYVYVLNPQEGSLPIRDAATFREVSFYDGTTLREISEELLLPESGRCIARGVGKVVCVDARTGTAAWAAEVPKLSGVVLSADRGTVYAISQDNFTGEAEWNAFSAETGEKRYSLPLPAEPYFSKRFCVNADGTRAALFRRNDLIGADGVLYLLDLESGRILAEKAMPYCPEELTFREDLLLLLGYDGEWAQFGTTSVHDVGEIRMEACRAETLEPVWAAAETAGTKAHFTAIRLQTVNVHEELPGTEPAAVFAYADRVVVVNAESGEVLRSYLLPASVCGVRWQRNGLEAVTADGSKVTMAYSHTDYSCEMSFNGPLDKAYLIGDAIFLQNERINTMYTWISRFEVRDNPNCRAVSAEEWNALLEQCPEDSHDDTEAEAMLNGLPDLPEYHRAGLTADGQRAWLLCADRTVALVSLSDGAVTGRFYPHTLNTNLYGDTRVQMTAEGTLLLFNLDGCIELDLTGDAPAALAVIQYCTAYDPATNTFLAKLLDNHYFLHRYSMEELIDMAEERLID